MPKCTASFFRLPVWPDSRTASARSVSLETIFPLVALIGGESSGAPDEKAFFHNEAEGRSGPNGAGVMDVFKLFFETTVVGVLTLAWLGVATYLLFPGFRPDSIVNSLPEFIQKNQTAQGVGALILTYCLGSPVLPIASQLVNDEHWPLNENGIRCQVLTNQAQYLKDIETGFPEAKALSLAGQTWSLFLLGSDLR